MFGVLRSVALFLVFVSSTSTRVDRLSEKYTVNIFAEIQWEPFSAPIFTVNPMIDDDVISIPFFDFSFFLILCVFDECRVFWKLNLFCCLVAVWISPPVLLSISLFVMHLLWRSPSGGGGGSSGMIWFTVDLVVWIWRVFRVWVSVMICFLIWIWLK